MKDFKATVRLFNNVPFSLNGSDTRYFNDRSEQTNWFKSRERFKEVDYSLIRENTGSVRLELSYEEVSTCNYMSFINESYENKEKYCFITEIEYVAEETIIVYFTVDYLQTYMFDFGITGLVDREHCNYNDLNTLPEDLGLGDYVVVKKEILKGSYSPRFAIVAMTTDITDPNGFKGGTATTDSYGVSQSYSYYVLNASNDFVTFNSGIWSLKSLDSFISSYATNPDLVNKVVSVQVVDVLPFPHTISRVETGQNTYKYDVTTTYATSVTIGALGVDYVMKCGNNTSFNKEHSFNKTGGSSYSQDSSKLNHYPYSVIELSNGSKTLQFKPELFTQNTISINEKRTLEIDSQVYYGVKDYSGESTYLNSLSYNGGVKMPVVSDNLSAYIQSRDNAYLSSAVLQTAMGIGMIALAPATGGASGIAGLTAVGASAPALIGAGVGTGINATVERFKSTEKAKRMPNDISGSQDKLLNMIVDVQTNLMFKKQTPEYMSIFESYFKAYGWKTLKNKNPNLRTRVSFNFVKMTSLNCTGNIPQQAKEEITKRFIEGITLWHIDSIGDYSVSNVLR